MTALYAYRTGPNMERKAKQELRNANIGAMLPTDTTGKRARLTAPSYIFADAPYRPAFAKHVRREIGVVQLGDVMNLFVQAQPRRAEDECPFEVGQSVYIGEVPGTVAEVRGRTCIVTIDMLGKQHSKAISYAHLRPG